MRLGFRRPGAPRGAYTPDPLFRRSRRPYATWAAIGFILTFLYVLVLFLSAQSIGAVHIVAGASAASIPTTTIIYENSSVPGQTSAAATAAAITAASATPASTIHPSSTSTSTLSLQIGTTPQAICAQNGTGCNAGTNTARVTLSAAAINAPAPFWPDVQVAFIIETTAYDGVFDHYNSFYGQDPCAAATSGQGPVCEESNGVPFFIANSGSVASAIQAANPHSNVSFALVDFFGTDCGDWDDCGDGYRYHVDIPTFIPTEDFGDAVRSTFQAEVLGGGWDGIFGLDDNFLHSPSITALYGTIIGSGLDWSPASHHVIVLIGSTAPRDPSYAENYWVSSFDHCCSGITADGWTCEPAYQFANGASPNCEGWVRSQDGNPNDSIAGLAHTASQCTESIGKVCTIDIVDLWDTATDPLSQGWPNSPGYPSGNAGAGPGGSGVLTDTDHVLLAGCDLAAATGGTWDGPAFASCPDGQSGTLQYVPHGPLSNPNTANPSLFNALKGIGFGPIYATLAANGTAKPLFTFVPFGGLKVAASPEFSAACTTPTGFLRTCDTIPKLINLDGITTLGWNWSTNATQNALYAGDVWTASFNIVNFGLPFGLVPVDACVSTSCAAGHSGALGGEYTSATYRPGDNGSAITQSFPLAVITVQITPAGASPPFTPPAPPIAPPGLPILTAPATPVIIATPTLQTLGVANLSVQATAAGFLGAGFTRVGMRNRPIAIQVAALSKGPGSRFESTSAGAKTSGVGRFV